MLLGFPFVFVLLRKRWSAKLGEARAEVMPPWQLLHHLSHSCASSCWPPYHLPYSFSFALILIEEATSLFPRRAWPRTCLWQKSVSCMNDWTWSFHHLLFSSLSFFSSFPRPVVRQIVAKVVTEIGAKYLASLNWALFNSLIVLYQIVCVS